MRKVFPPKKEKIMATSLVENEIQLYKQTKSAPSSFDWEAVKRLRINEPAPEMTGSSAMQKNIGVRRRLIGLIDEMARRERSTSLEPAVNQAYRLLIDRRKELSSAQRFDRLRLAGKR